MLPLYLLYVSLKKSALFCPHFINQVKEVLNAECSGLLLPWLHDSELTSVCEPVIESQGWKELTRLSNPTIRIQYNPVCILG